jgi:hypothetical protein
MIKGCSVERYDVDEGYGYHKADTIVASLTACTFAVFLPGHRDTLKGKFERCSKDTWLWRRYTLFPDPTLIVDGKKWGEIPILHLFSCATSCSGEETVLSVRNVFDFFLQEFGPLHHQIIQRGVSANLVGRGALAQCLQRQRSMFQSQTQSRSSLPH